MIVPPELPTRVPPALLTRPPPLSLMKWLMLNFAVLSASMVTVL